MASQNQLNHPSISQRKKILQDELKRLENKMESDFSGIRSDMDTYLKPKEIIKKHPLSILGVSILVGFLIGKGRRKAEKKRQGSYVDLNGQYMPAIPAKPASKRDGIISMIWGELKRHIARKGTDWAMQHLEERIKEFNQQKRDQEQEEKE